MTHTPPHPRSSATRWPTTRWPTVLGLVAISVGIVASLPSPIALPVIALLGLVHCDVGYRRLLWAHLDRPTGAEVDPDRPRGRGI